MRVGPSPEILERLAYANGTRLLDGDFARIAAYEPALIAAHLRCAHRTWGIGEGLRVSMSASRTSVTVAAGTAWNCRGEVLVLEQAARLDLPPRSVDGVEVVDLVLRTPDRGCACGEPPPDTCTGEESRLARVPTVEWVSTGPTSGVQRPTLIKRPGLDLPLARFTLGGAGALHGPDLTVRQHANPLRSSRIHFGTAKPGKNGWVRDDDGSRVATIATSAAGFSRPPIHVAWPVRLAWHPVIVGPWISVEDIRRDAFLARVRMGCTAGDEVPAFPDLFFDSFEIAWMGAEPIRGCPGNPIPRFAIPQLDITNVIA